MIFKDTKWYDNRNTTQCNSVKEPFVLENVHKTQSLVWMCACKCICWWMLWRAPEMLAVAACRMTSSEPLCIGFSTKLSKDYRQFCSPAFKYNPAVRIRVPKMHSVIAVIIQHGAVVKEMKFLIYFATADETSGVFNTQSYCRHPQINVWSHTYFVDKI